MKVNVFIVIMLLLCVLVASGLSTTRAVSEEGMLAIAGGDNVPCWCIDSQKKCGCGCKSTGQGNNCYKCVGDPYTGCTQIKDATYACEEHVMQNDPKCGVLWTGSAGGDGRCDAGIDCGIESQLACGKQEPSGGVTGVTCPQNP